MEFMGKKLEDLVVTLPYEDGTEVDYGVYSYFEVNHKQYFAMLPLKGKKELDFSQMVYYNIMLSYVLLQVCYRFFPFGIYLIPN